MTRPDFNPAHKEFFDAMLLGLPGVTPGKMFGYPAYFVGGKLFACVYGDGVGIKLPEKLTASLLANTHIVPFQPMGRAIMREWVQINRASSSDYECDRETFLQAIRFVQSLNQVTGTSGGSAP